MGRRTPPSWMFATIRTSCALERRALASEATGVALIALLDPKVTDKKQAIDAMLDEYVAYDTDAKCSLENNWCDAPEPWLWFADARLPGCVGAHPGAVGWALALILGAGLLIRRKRHAVAAAVVPLLLCGVVEEARADDENSGPIDGPAAALSGTSDAAVPGKVDKGGAFFGRVAVGASYDNSAFSTGLGARYQLNESWMLGFDGEWNPYRRHLPDQSALRLRQRLLQPDSPLSAPVRFRQHPFVRCCGR